MLSSIHPLGESGRGNRFRRTATAFAVGSAVGGILVGSLVGLVGFAIRAVLSISQETSLVAVCVVGIVALGFDLTGRALPSVHRQVNEDWLSEFRGWVYGFGFGVQLGAGVATYITSAAVLLWLSTIMLSGSLAGSVLIGATFGLTRGLSLVPARSIDSPARLVDFHHCLHRSAPVVRIGGSAVLVVVTMAAGALAVGSVA
jgi:hypothetical protein